METCNNTVRWYLVLLQVMGQLGPHETCKTLLMSISTKNLALVRPIFQGILGHAYTTCFAHADEITYSYVF